MRARFRTLWPILILIGLPASIAAAASFGPWITDATLLFSGASYDYRPGRVAGGFTIDPNMGFTAYALGVRAALDVLSGVLPLWNHYEGLGAPLLGEMQAAALFPPTLLLLLPHGQMLEQAALQAVAGVGTYLFLRRFGLGAAAALAGGLLFELNGVFAWLRNAIFNPVAFLPWLFYAVESLFAAASAGRAVWQRLPIVALGAVAAALAIYAGFPEVVYFYSLLVLLWAMARGVALPLRRVPSYLGDLLAVGILALLISAPVLLAFASFLGQGELAGHQADQFANETLSPPTLLMYLLPYVYGPISASQHPILDRIWAGIGGYLGLMPLLLAVAGLLGAWRRPACWLLAAWMLLALGATHGAPVLHAAFIQLPLVKIAAYCRYLNTSWIFCAAVLSAVFIDRLPHLTRLARRNIGRTAGALTLAILAVATRAAWPLLGDLLRPGTGHRLHAILSFAPALVLLAAAVAATALRRPARAQAALIVLAAGEALVMFLLPFASYPRDTKLDRRLIEFLQHHAGLQRVATGGDMGMVPNFGSVFGIPMLNYDDLPVPTRTVDYIRSRIDPAANAIMFRPSQQSLQLPPEQRQAQLRAQLPGYAAAGVRYLLGDADLLGTPAYGVAGPGLIPKTIFPGQTLAFDLQRGPAADPAITAVTIRVGTFGGKADGRLRLRLCRGADCADAAADLTGAAENGPLVVRLSAPLALAANDSYRLTLQSENAAEPVAIWMRHARPHAFRAAPADGLAPDVTFIATPADLPVMRSRAAAVFEVPGVRPYAAADGCTIDSVSFDRMVAECERPSRLVRLEVMMQGWQARVNDAATPIELVEQTFQGVALPQGRSTVSFTYAPHGVRESAWVAAATLLGLVAACLFARRRIRAAASP